MTTGVDANSYVEVLIARWRSENLGYYGGASYIGYKELRRLFDNLTFDQLYTLLPYINLCVVALGRLEDEREG